MLAAASPETPETPQAPEEDARTEQLVQELQAQADERRRRLKAEAGARMEKTLAEGLVDDLRRTVDRLRQAVSDSSFDWQPLMPRITEIVQNLAEITWPAQTGPLRATTERTTP